MSRFGLIGPSYTSQSLNANAQKTLNLFLENDESGMGKSQAQLFYSPGTKIFATFPDSPIRGELFLNFAPGLLFVVAGSTLFSLAADATVVKIASGLANDGLPVSMAGSPNQILIASAGSVYVYNTQTQVFTVIASVTLTNVALVGYSDGYFLALQKNAAKWQVSALLDATSWSGLQVTISVLPDNAVSMIVDHREAWIFGGRSSQVFYDSGNIFPFDPHPSGFIEQGCIATFSPCKLDNSVFWLGGDDRGSGIAWRAQGYTPQRISNHAVELAWQGYSTLSDAISYAFQLNGHTFWHLHFPSAKKSWRYDVATGMWHEVGYLETNGTITAHRSAFHQFAFGKHLVGDWKSGNIYDMSLAYLDDFGNKIRRVRRSPPISKENEWVYHEQLQVDTETGLWPQPPLLDGNNQPRGPQMLMRFSDDSGHTWSNEYSVDCGQAGEFQKRAIWRRLGRSRNRVYEISMSDPVPWRIIEGDLKAKDEHGNPLFEAKERLPKEFAKVT